MTDEQKLEQARVFLRELRTRLIEMQLEGKNREALDDVWRILTVLAPDPAFTRDGSPAGDVVKILHGDQEGFHTLIKKIYYSGDEWIYEVFWLETEYSEKELERFQCCRFYHHLTLENPKSHTYRWVYLYDKTGNIKTYDVVTHCRHCNTQLPEIF